MKQIMILALLLMTPIPTYSQVKDKSEKERFKREVMKAEEEWRAAVAEGDGRSLERLMADDILYVTNGGELAAGAPASGSW